MLVQKVPESLIKIFNRPSTYQKTYFRSNDGLDMMPEMLIQIFNRPSTYQKTYFRSKVGPDMIPEMW